MTDNLSNVSSLDPAPDTLFGNTGTSYTAAQLITFASQSVVNTVFTAPTPKPSWFDDLNKQLQGAQAVAQMWLDTYATEVTSTIPLQVINFGSSFTAATDAILQIVNEHGDATGADNPYVIEIKEIIEQTLLPPIQAVMTNMAGIGTSLATWGNQMQQAHTGLVTGATNIQSAEIALQADIDRMNNAISTLNDAIKSENQAIAASAAAIAIGIFALVVGIALAPETGGASLLIGGAIGVAGIVGGGVTWGVMQDKINNQFSEIAQDQQEKSDDQRQIVALQGLQVASSNAVSSIELATSSLSKLQTQWGVFQGELQAVVTKLESAETALSTIVQGVFTSAAKTEWADAIETANNLVNAKVQMDSKMLPMDSQSAA